MLVNSGNPLLYALGTIDASMPHIHERANAAWLGEYPGKSIRNGSGKLKPGGSSRVLVRPLAADAWRTFATHNLPVDRHGLDVVAGRDVEHHFEHHSFEDGA